MQIPFLQFWKINIIMELLSQQILECFKQEQSFAIVTIMTHKGSTPRTSGSKMIVLQDRTIYGTIGGGLVEAMIIDSSIELISENKCQINEFALNQKLKDGLDMVCGGDMVVLIETYTQIANENLPHTSNLESIFNAVINIEKSGQNGFLVSKINGFSQSKFTVQKCFVLPDGTITGNILIPKPIMEAIQNNEFSGTSPQVVNHGLEEFIIEPIQPRDIVYIFGAGHVGFQLAKVAHLTDFAVIVTDDREEFANWERFPDARDVRTIDNFDNAFDNLSIDDHSYIVILTRGHLHDQTVLETALKTKAAYIGMIGSKGKRKQIYSNLMTKGVKKSTLDTVYSPIGIEINSETPAEIAVSIIGQIIQIRANK
jgi:xanthine dehydrogenase accessory factor